jgi:uncharacterized protein (TIGR02246 family)
MPVNRLEDVHPFFATAFNNGDTAALLTLYHPDAVLIVDGKPVTGHDQILAELKGFIELQGQMELTPRSINTFGDTALMIGDWTITSAELNLKGTSAEVLQRQPDGSWVYIIDNPFAA